MTNLFNLYVSNLNSEAFSTLQGMANMGSESLATLIGRAMRYYVNDLNGEPHLILDKKLWNKRLDKMSHDELLENNKHLLTLQHKITDRL